MNIRKKLAGFSFMSISALLLAACGSGEGVASGAAASLDEMEPITLTVAEYNPEGTVWLEGLKTMIEYVEEESDGKIEFELYTGASLMEAEDMLSGVGSGQADMGRVGPSSYWPQELPISNWYQELGAEKELSFPHGMLQQSARAHELHVSDGPLRSELESVNVTPLTAMTQSRIYDMMCTTPVNSAEDAEGLRVRTLGEIWASEAQALGMVDVPMPVNEVYEGLQRGVVDCAVIQVPSHMDYGVWEVATEYVPAQMTNVDTLVLGINSDTWEALPPDAQHLMNKGAHLAWTTMKDEVLSSYAEFAIDGTELHSVEFNDSSELDEILEEYQAERVEGLASRAPEGLEDPEGLIEETYALNEKWDEIVGEHLSIEKHQNSPEETLEAYRNAVDVDTSGLWDAFWEAGFEPNE